MKILFWVPYPTEGASNRYRVEQYLPYLKSIGVESTLRPFWNCQAYGILYKPNQFFKKWLYFILGTISRCIDILNIKRYDLVFIHREAYPIGGAFFETILYLLGKPFIFDFDDAIFLPTSSSKNKFINFLKNSKKTAKIIKMSKFVIVGNRYLADYSLRFNSNIQIIPTSVDTDKYCSGSKQTNNKIVIGWIGSITTIEFLNSISHIFITLSKRYKDLIFKVVGEDFSLRNTDNIVNKAWNLKEEIEDLQTFDIGIMPMPDNEWAKGKCGFKAILYMSMGIPCVCSPVGVNKELVIDGANGFLADTDKEWLEKLALLIENAELRRKMGIAGRRIVEEKYSVRVNAPKFLEILNKVYKEGRDGR